MRPTKHLALEHLQAVDVSLHGAATPGQGHPGFDRRVVFIQSQGKAAHRLQRTGSRALQPVIKRLRLALTDPGGKILRQRDRLGDLGRLHLELDELLGLGDGALLRAPQHQPGSPARRQGPARRLGHGRQGLACAAVPGSQTLDLPQPVDIGSNHPIAARIAALTEVAKQPHGGVASRIPALEQIWFIGVKDTRPEVAASSALRKTGGAEIALDRAQTQSDLLRNGCGCPALAVQGPDLGMQRLPLSLAPRGTLLRRQRDIVDWHRHSARPGRQCHGLLAPQGIDRLQGLPMCGKHLVQCFPEILQEMKAVSDLDGRRSPLPRALGVGGRAIACDDLDPRMFPQPLGQSIGRAIRQKRDRVAALQINQYGAIALAFAQREIIYPKDRRSRTRQERRPPQQAQQRVPAHGRLPPATEVYPGRAAHGHAESDQALGQSQRASRPGSHHPRQPFGEDPPPTVAIAAKPLADT